MSNLNNNLINELRSYWRPAGYRNISTVRLSNKIDQLVIFTGRRSRYVDITNVHMKNGVLQGRTKDTNEVVYCYEGSHTWYPRQGQAA